MLEVFVTILAYLIAVPYTSIFVYGLYLASTRNLTFAFAPIPFMMALTAWAWLIAGWIQT